MITSDAMKKLENQSEKKGTSKVELMERAGKGIYEALQKKFDLDGKRILILCYHGNNGGDGFTAARYLARKAVVDVLFIGEEHKLKEEAMINYMKTINTHDINLLRPDDAVDMNNYDILIDALLGIGATGDLKDPIATYLRAFNDAEAYKVAIDVPTGISPDTGAQANAFADFDLLIAFHDIKVGLKEYKDKTVIVDIGL